MQRILVIDDDPDIRDALSSVLAAEGYEVDTAANGAEGLERLDEDPLPQVIVLDLMMPGMSGWDFRARQLESPRLAGIPVILLSASSQTGEAAAVLGVADVLCKPLSLAALLDSIERHAAAA